MWFFSAEDEVALKKSAVVNWYLKEIESEIDSEMELMNKKAMIDKVIHRLVHCVRKYFVQCDKFMFFECLSLKTCFNKLCFCLYQDYILIELTQSGLKGSAESTESQEDVTLVVNPNYTFDD